MSDPNIDPSITDPKDPPPPSKPELSNIEMYNLKKKLKVEVEEEIEEKAKEVDPFLLEAIEARKLNAPQYILNLIEKLDPQSQLIVLKEHAEKNKDPNTSSLPTPIGKDKDPLEEYMTYNPTKDTISYDIPASVLMNPNKNKKLLGIE